MAHVVNKSARKSLAEGRLALSIVGESTDYKRHPHRYRPERTFSFKVGDVETIVNCMEAARIFRYLGKFDLIESEEDESP